MKFICFFILILFVGCVSNENVVLVKQIESTNSIVLRMKKDKNSIFSLSYPLSFKIKKTDNRDIYYAENSYLFIYFKIRNLVQAQLLVI